MERDAALLVTGGSGMVGSALLRELTRLGYSHALSPQRGQLDLADRSAVQAYFEIHRPAYCFMLAARVGGIQANMDDPLGFLSDNLCIEQNLFSACEKFPPKKCLFLGSSCVYPRDCPQPMREEYLLSGPLEPTNEGYALAKIAGLKMAQFLHKRSGILTVCPMPCNLYGTGDHFDLQKAHVLSSLVKRFVDARRSAADSVTLWGNGSARREFLHVDDIVRAMLFFMEKVESTDIMNVGAGADISIRELAQLVCQVSGFRGQILWDTSKPNGMPRKCLDVSRVSALGFKPQISLQEGIERTVREYETLMT